MLVLQITKKQMAFYQTILLFCLLFASVKGSLCPHVAGQRTLTDVGALRLYIDPSDEDVESVSSLFSLLADPDGNVSIFSNGVISTLFSNEKGTLFPIPSSVQVIPMHITTDRELYYSFSIISPTESILGPFINVTPNSDLLVPGEIADISVEFCCKAVGSVILQGCLTIGTESFDELNGTYVTLGPFYSTYQCDAQDVKKCPSSLPLFLLISTFCFTYNQTISVVEEGGGSWMSIISVYNPGGTKFCFFDSLTGSIIPFLTDEQSNANLPIGLQFDGLDLFFEINKEHDFDGLVGYSMAYVSQNRSILRMPNTTVPLQGAFEEDLYFTLNLLPCEMYGTVIIDIYLNTSSFLDGIVFNNSFSFFFHRSCTPDNNSSLSTHPVEKPPLQIILPSTIIPTFLIIFIAIVVAIILVIVTRKQKRVISHLEELTQHVDSNLYSMNVIKNPFEFLDEHNIEYNFALLEVVDKLGEGYFGNVYKARAPGLSDDNDFFAVKTLKEDSENDTMESFAKEIRTCIQFDHPNVVKLLAVCTHSVQKCMIFEYMDLGSLDYALRRSCPNDENYNASDPNLIVPDQFLNIVIQISRGLTHLSSLNFVHRDIAARNCLLDTKFRVKIADFGLSRNISAQNYYRIGSGKNYLPIRWMPPEALFYGKFTLQSDVWSYGVLMWEVYTYGQLPFTGLSNYEVIDNIKASKVLNRPDLCPLGVYDIMHSCWVRIPSRRPTIGQILHRLELFERGEVDHTTSYVNLVPKALNDLHVDDIEPDQSVNGYALLTPEPEDKHFVLTNPINCDQILEAD